MNLKMIVDHKDSKRVRFTHTKTRQTCRHGVDSVIEGLTHAKLEDDRALDKANKTLHRLREEIPLESEAATNAAELNSIRDSESIPSEADANIISGKCVLKPHKARYVLRSFEEDVKDEDGFASTTMTASVRLLLSQATDLRNEGYTVFTADVKTAFLNAHMLDGDVVNAKPPPEWQPETLDANYRNSDLETSKNLHRLRSDTNMRNIKSILRYFRGTPGIMKKRPTTLSLEAVKRAPVAQC